MRIIIIPGKYEFHIPRGKCENNVTFKLKFSHLKRQVNILNSRKK